MKIFEKPNTKNNWKCLICGISDEKPVVLIPVVGTEEGNNMRAEQVHVNCIDLFLYDLEEKIIIGNTYYKHKRK